MEYYKKKYRADEIEMYQRILEIETHLQKNDYQYMETIRGGSYGFVMKIKHVTLEKSLQQKLYRRNMQQMAN